MDILFNDWVISCPLFYQLALPIPPMAPSTLIPTPNPQSKPSAARRFAPARPDGFPLRAAALSVLGHVIAIAIVMNTPLGSTIPAPEQNVIAIRLVPGPVIEAPPPTAQEPIPATLPETRADKTEADLQPAVAAEDPAIVDEPSTADPGATDGSGSSTDPGQTGTLRATLLDQVRSLPAETDGEGEVEVPWAASGDRIPGVPGVRGWISGYVGAVAPSAHTWNENDGSSRGRYVLADGTIICTRRRAPTIDEMMNPWKSIAVTMGGICGRQRPGAVDYSDPRIQPPPRAEALSRNQPTANSDR